MEYPISNYRFIKGGYGLILFVSVGRFKYNGQNFQVQLSESKREDQSAPVIEISNVTVPEDLVQIQAYIRWERKGKQMYTPDQEKVAFVDN